MLATLAPKESEIKVEGRWLIRRVLPYRTLNKRISGVAITFSDITQLKVEQARARRALEDLKRLKAERSSVVERSADQLRALASELVVREARERQKLAVDLHEAKNSLKR